MQGLARLIVLAAVIVAMTWFFLKLNPDRPATRQSPSTTSNTNSGETSEREPWTREERANWREGINQRLHR